MDLAAVHTVLTIVAISIISVCIHLTFASEIFEGRLIQKLIGLTMLIIECGCLYIVISWFIGLIWESL